MTVTGRAPMRTKDVAFLAVVLAALLAPVGARGQQPVRGTEREPSAATTVEASDPVLGEALLRLAVQRNVVQLVDAAHRYYQLGIRDRAIELYSEAIERDSRVASAYDGRARVLRDWGLHEQALGDAHRATYFAPGSAEAWNTVGTIFQALNRIPEARAAFIKATLSGPAPFAWSNLCYLSFVGGQVAEASVECGMAIEQDPDHRYARNNLALIHAALGDLNKASELFQAAGGEAARHYNIGIVLLAMRNYSAAARAFEAASRVEPTMTRAHSRARDARRRARMETSK
jgi:tetratricopeptide (TPR) repeat protein